MTKKYFKLLQDKEWLEEQYINKQRTYKDIGDEIGCTKHGVYHAIKRFNIKPRIHSSKYPQLNDKEWLKKMYVEELLSTKQIADLIGSTVGNVGSALVTMGIKLRNTKEGWHARFPNGRWGEHTPNWKNGITPENHRIRTSTDYALWRKAVFERDNYTCRFCAKRGGDIEADHIKPFAYFPELRFSIDNSRTLCVPCHKKTETHSQKMKIDKEIELN